MLAELEQQRLTGDLRAVAEVGIRPSAKAIGETGHYFRFLAQLDRRPRGLSNAFAAGSFKSALRVLELQVEAGLDHVPPAILERRKRFGIHLVVGALADLEAEARGPVGGDDLRVGRLRRRALLGRAVGAHARSKERRIRWQALAMT